MSDIETTLDALHRQRGEMVELATLLRGLALASLASSRRPRA